MKTWNCLSLLRKCVGPVAFGAIALAMAMPSLDAQRRKARVYVDSFASKEYQERKDGEEGPIFETYHFFKGKFFGGNIADNSLNKVTFQEVVETLAEYMQPRNYFPAKGVENGDLLIVVHYGVTGVEESWDDLMGVTSYDTGGGDDFGSGEDGGEDSGPTDSFDSSGSDFNGSTGTEYSEAMNAKMLGFNKALYKKGLMPQDEYELRQELKDERYFIILMAYDWQHLRTAKEFKLLWSTRFSINGIGTNFVDAHYTLSRAAMGYFGTNLEDLESERTFHGRGKIERGELEIIGTEEVPERKPKE